MKKADRDYWRLKNRIGYAVISNNHILVVELKKQLESILKRKS